MARGRVLAALLSVAGCAAEPAQERLAANQPAFEPAPVPVCLRGTYKPGEANLVELAGAFLAGTNGRSGPDQREIEKEARHKACVCSVC